jgi:hypothetical protein
MEALTGNIFRDVYSLPAFRGLLRVSNDIKGRVSAFVGHFFDVNVTKFQRS